MGNISFRPRLLADVIVIQVTGGNSPDLSTNQKRVPAPNSCSGAYLHPTVFSRICFNRIRASHQNKQQQPPTTIDLHRSTTIQINNHPPTTIRSVYILIIHDGSLGSAGCATPSEEVSLGPERPFQHAPRSTLLGPFRIGRRDR